MSMQVNRREFLGIILACGVSPAIVRASSLMPGRGIVVPSRHIETLDRGIISAIGGSRTFTCRLNSPAFVETVNQGLDEVYRLPGDLVVFRLPTPLGYASSLYGRRHF